MIVLYAATTTDDDILTTTTDYGLRLPSFSTTLMFTERCSDDSAEFWTMSQ